MSPMCKFYCCFIFFCCSCILTVNGQRPDSLPPAKHYDSLPVSEYVKKARRLAVEQNENSIRLYKDGKTGIARRNTIDNIKSLSQRIKLYLKDGLDTAEISNELEKTKQSLAIAKDGIINNKGITQTQRNLYVTANIVTELLVRMSDQKLALDKFTNTLAYYKDKLDSLSSDPALYNFPSDSAGIIKFAKHLFILNKEIGPVDSSLKSAFAITEELQLHVDMMVYDLRAFNEDIEIFRSNVGERVLDRELPNIWESSGFNRPMNEIIRFSVAKEKMVLGFYIKENPGRLVILLILIGCATFFARSVRKLILQEKLLDPDFKGQLVLKYPLASSVFVVLNIFQFIYIYPPFIFSFCIWCISIICLTVIFRETLTKYWTRFWYMVILFFVLTAADNFLLQASRSERWFMFILSAIGIFLFAGVFLKKHIQELKEKGIIIFIVFVAIAETASLLFNIYGRFNMSKSFLITGYIGIAIAILFLWTIRLINEMLSLTFRVYKFPDRRMFYINFDRIGTEVPTVFYAVMVLGWFLIIGRTFYAFKQLTGPFENYLARTRTVGEFTFSISNILIFLMILILSVVLSRIISFFASAPPSPHGTTKGEKIGIGSWLLLVRIFILTLGLVLAFAATGIPVDKLTIILGALSVGIGLGLQSLVTNLVSGLIIAFEKPVNVGDLLELNGKMATMKSIGFRSSVARLSDGAHVVIPNGDVLSQHLVNWSMGKNTKKTILAVRVAYGTDLEKARKLLSEILAENERILKYPSPGVYAKEFGTSSVNFELSFWTNHIAEEDSVKSEVITAIDKTLRSAGISIPLPKQEIDFRQMGDVEKTE
jgi:potassium-dependent mechanosensitive channel